MTFDSILNSLISEKDATLAKIDNLINEQGSTTLLTDTSVSYAIPTPTFNETSDEWTLTQNTADTDGLYKGLYQLALSTGCSKLTIVNHNIVTPDDGIPARYAPCNGSLTNVSSVTALNNLFISKLEFRSKNPFSVTVKLTLGDYRTYVHEFSNGMGDWVIGWSAGVKLGELVSTGLRGTLNSAASQRAIYLYWYGFNPAWRIRSVKMYHRQENAGQVSSNSRQFRIRPIADSNTSAVTPFAGSGVNDATHVSCNTIVGTNTYWTNANQLFMAVTCINNASPQSQVYIDKIEITFVNGFAPSGYKTDDNNLCT